MQPRGARAARPIARRALAAVVGAWCGAAALGACGAAGGAASEPGTAAAADQAAGSSDRRAYVQAVAAILADERAAFTAFFGPAADAWAAPERIASAERQAQDFHAAMLDAETRARALESPPTATLYHGAFLEHFDRFVADAAAIREAIRASDLDTALNVYTRLRRGALARLDFLDERLALIEP